jgi:aryl-alcohol dehydrogenase-like predicted oxidoreductase
MGSSQDETSEEFISEWAESRGVRDQVFIATKVEPRIHRYDSVFVKLTQFLVHYQLQTEESYHTATGQLYRKQRQIYVPVRRGVPEEAPLELH